MMQNATPIEKADVCDGAQAPAIFDEVMKLVGDYWNLRIVDALQNKELRFTELQRAVVHINPVTLTTRLRKLEEADVIVRACETCDKQSVTYALTTKGHGLVTVLVSIRGFATTYWGK